MSLLRRPVFWVVLLVLTWLALVTVQIALGMGTAPDEVSPKRP
jgi:hypothetical protein